PPPAPPAGLRPDAWMPGVGPESVEEFTHLERRRKNGDGTERDGLLADVFGVNGHDDHLEPRVEDEDPSQRLEAAKSRRSEIEHHSIGTLTLHVPEGFETIDRLDDLEPLPTQERGDHLVNLRLVGHHEDPWAC